MTETESVQFGLLFAGILKYVDKSTEMVAKEMAKVKLFVDIFLGGLTAVPGGGGAAFAASQPIADTIIEQFKAGRMSKFEILQNKMKEWFFREIHFPMMKHGAVKVRNWDNHSVKVEVNRFVFWQYCNMMLKYNGMGDIC
jgi:hypothetical protein